MNYQQHYNNLINRSKNRFLDIYTDTHHIVPKCMGGNDDAANLAELTPEEHYVAHQLLVSEEHRRKISESKKGKKRENFVPPNKGIPMSDEQKKKISETKRLSKLKKETPNGLLL